MRVAIDTNGLFTTQAGVARYIHGLLRGLRQIQAPGVDYYELAWEVENFGYRQPQRALKTAYRELFWAKAVAPAVLRARGTDLLHSTVNCMIAPPRSMKHVVSIMDLAFLRHPERFRRWQRWSWTKLLRRLPGVDHVMCISRFTADEVIRVVGLPASKVEVVYLGCEFLEGGGVVPEQKPDVVVPDDFFLFVGSLEPGKNLTLLKQVYQIAQEQGQRFPPLMIMGARWEGVANEGPPPVGWHYLGRQPDAVLVYLYRRARALCFPSKFEGFGLPLVEAMALGCPVICSPLTSLPEVGGEAVLFTELNPESYFKSMVEILSNEGLREDLIGRGREQAKKFTWENCARETVGIYEKVMGRS